MQIDEYLNAQDFSPRTKEDYGKDLRALERFIGNRKEPSREDIQAYRHELEGRGSSRSHISRTLYAIKGYTEWQGLDFFAKAHEKSKEKIRIPGLDFKEPPRTRTVEEVERLSGAARTPLERVLVLLLATTGLRIGEFMGIDIGDLNWEEREVTVTRKGRRKRRQAISLSESVIADLKEYCAWRGVKKGKLFPYTYQDLRKYFRDLAKRANVEFPRHSLFHNLRHFFVLYQKRAGVDLRFISLAAGHTSLQTTDRIYGMLGPEEVRAQLEPFPWEKEAHGN